MTQAIEPMTASWKRAVLPAILLLALNLFVFGTMTVYFGNQGEFLVEDEDILKVLLVPAGALVLLLALVTVPLSRWRPAATGAVMSFLALVTYLHGNVLRWETGILDGAALRSDRTWPLVADAALWVVLAALIWRYRGWLAVHGWKLCILLMVFQLIGAVDLKHNAKTGNRELQEVPAALYAFNAGPNVLHLILDGFQGNVFEYLLDEDPSRRGVTAEDVDLELLVPRGEGHLPRLGLGEEPFEVLLEHHPGRAQLLSMQLATADVLVRRHVVHAEAVCDYLREVRGLKVGVVNLTMFRPFPGDLIGKVLKGRKGVAVLERTDQPLAEDLPIMREVRAALNKCVENGAVKKKAEKPHPDYVSCTADQMPALYSAAYGLGSRDLQPEALIAAFENMLPDAQQRKFFYLGIDFVREPTDPKDEIRIQQTVDAYPQIKDLALKGSENPDLLPEGAITVRMHSVGGWGAVTTGKNLAMTLYELLGFDIRANPKYGSEKKGQPTTYFLSAAPEPIRLNCEYTYVDVVMSPDPNVFTHSNPLFGLKKGGVFIIQSELNKADEVWKRIPVNAQRFIVEHDIHVYFVDGFRIAREEASSAELQFRMQGNAFQGAFFAASPLAQQAGLSDQKLLEAIRSQLQHKFGGKGASWSLPSGMTSVGALMSRCQSRLD